MYNKKNCIEIICGLFVSATTMLDWYWNASLRYRPFSSEERYRCDMFLERPERVLPPPDIWWETVVCLAFFFFTGYVSAKVAVDFYHSRHTSFQNRYLKSIALVAAAIGLSSGAFLFLNVHLLPIVCKIYISIGWGIVTFLGAHLSLHLPYQLVYGGNKKSRREKLSWLM